jgi:hypothetical protein
LCAQVRGYRKSGVYMPAGTSSCERDMNHVLIIT